MSTSPGAVLGNALLIGPSRIGSLIFASVTVILTLEAARRVLRSGAGLLGYSPDNRVGQFVNAWTPAVAKKFLYSIQPPIDDVDAQAGKGISHTELAKAITLCAVIGNVGWELSKWLSGGEVSPYYNQVARFIGPLVLDEQYRHPVVKYGVDMVKNAFPSLR